VKIGIAGAGAIGLTFATALARAHDVIVLTRRASVAELLSRDGVGVMRDAGTEHVPLRATADPRAFADRDAVIVAVKAFATGDALAPLRGVLQPHVLVASVQNGIDYAALARAALPEARIVAGSTTQGAIRLGDGRIQPANRGTTTFGLDDSGSPSSDDLAAAFVSAGLDARVADDIEAVLWRKLILNAAVNPSCALAGRTNGAVATDPDLEAVARGLAGEAAAVARAQGVDAGDPWAAVKAAASASAANRNSMLQDLDAGRPTEIDAISGAIVRRARAHGIPVPLTETVLRLVRARERAAANRESGADG
jgi:2-dehydropantoate 2-reductase